jgi:hypothetical protein
MEEPPSPTFSELKNENPFYERRMPPKNGAWHKKSNPVPPKSTMRDKDHHRGFTPKMSFPRLDGSNPCIWKEKCQNYFMLMDTPENMWPTAASLHMDGNVEKWMHMHKKKHGMVNWSRFMVAVQQKFGVYEDKHAIDDILELWQEGTVKEYVTNCEALQYRIKLR